MAAFDQQSVTLIAGETPHRIRGASVTPNLFQVLGVDAALGRTLTPAQDAPGGERAVVLSHGLWRSHFGGDADVLGTTVRLNGVAHTVVGVMPSGFGFLQRMELWAASPYRVPEPPFDLGGDPSDSRGAEYFDVVGRLKDGVTLEQAQAQMSAVAKGITEANPGTNLGESVLLTPLLETLVGDVRPTLYILFGATGLLLLIATANVASLLLVRASGRDREVALRLALGAGRWRIARQLATESLLLAMAGALLGFLLAHWGTQGLLALAPSGIPRADDVATGLGAAGFTFVVALTTGILFGVAPALFSVRDGQLMSISQTSRKTTSGAHTRLRRIFVTGEVAVSLLLLVGAGLLLRTFVAVNGTAPGFDPAKTLAAHLTPPQSRYASDEELRGFFANVLQGVERIPGVESAGGVLSLPVSSAIQGDLIVGIENRPVTDDDQPHAGYQLVSGEYFAALGIPLIRGRLFSGADDETATPVALINQAMADLYWSGEDPVGRRITWNGPDNPDIQWVTIVGIVGNTRHDGLDEAPRPETYLPYGQTTMPYMTVVVRSQVEAVTLTDAVRRAVAEVDPEIPVWGVSTMEQILADSLAWRRFRMLLMALFAGTALTLATVGLYGVLSFAVARRSNEIGIRVALGAGVRTVIGDVIRDGMRLAVWGLVLGTAASVAMTRLMSGLVYGVDVVDPVSIGGGAVFLLLVALSASALPAARAAKVDPAAALKEE
jgi:predicted permease